MEEERINYEEWVYLLGVRLDRKRLFVEQGSDEWVKKRERIG